MATRKKSVSVQLTAKLYDRMKKLDNAENQVTALQADIKELKGQLYSEMENDNIEELTYKELKFKKTDEVQFSLAESYAGRKWDEIDDWFDYLRESGNEGMIKIMKTVNAQTRNAFLRRLYEENPDKIPGFIKVSFFNTIKTRKA